MKKVITRNIPLKILSFLLAIVLWVVIMNIEDPYITQTIDNIPVNQVNTNVFEESNQIYDVESGDTVSIQVRGKRSVIEHLKYTDFVATADFKEMSQVYAVPIRVVAKESSRYDRNDIEIIEQNDVMTLSLEDADTQTFRVNVKTTGEAKDGFFVTDLVADPNIIEISGSKKQIAKIREVIVEVSIEQIANTFEITTTPKALDENGYPVDDAKLVFQTKQIKVAASVLPTKDVMIVVSKEGSPHYGYTFTKMVYEPKQITIAGLPEDLEQIGYITIPFDINLSKETKGETKYIEEYLDMTKYRLVGESNSVVITANIEKLETKELSIFTSAIKVLNLETGYEASIQTPGMITTQVMGPKQELAEITVDKLEPYIDVAGLKPGTHTVTIASKASANLNMRPVAISVKIEKAEKP